MPAMRHVAILPALLACAVISAGCGTSTREVWQPEQRVEIEALTEPSLIEERSAGMLKLRVEQEIRTIETPSERLYLIYKQTYSDFDWDRFGFAFFAVAGAVVMIGLYVLFAFYVIDTDEDA
jgi:hypothetical protein